MLFSLSLVLKSTQWLEAFLYSSRTEMIPVPSSLSWYCAAAHTAPNNYTLPPQLFHNGDHPDHSSDQSYKLVHLIHVQRHAKRTPVNLLPNEELYNPPQGWQCNNIDYFTYAKNVNGGGAVIEKRFEIPDWHPLKARFWNGTCESGPLTSSGLQDAIQQGKDLWDIYSPNGKNPIADFNSPFPTKHNTHLRTSTEERTFQVAAGLLEGMQVPSDHSINSFVMPATLDDIPPGYSCTYVNTLRTAINAEKDWTDHLASKSALFNKLNDVLGTANMSGWNSWIDHPFDALSSRQCHGHPLPTNPTTGESISQDIADQVYAEGNWEYNYIWNASPNADEYTKYSIAVLAKELAVLLESIKTGKNDKKLSLFVGHDGTMVRLFKTLGMPNIMWPGMGSEVNFEIYQSNHKSHSRKKSKPQYFVRLLSYGQTFKSTVKALTGSDQVAEIAWVPLDNVIDYLNSRVPTDLAQKCS